MLPEFIKRMLGFADKAEAHFNATELLTAANAKIATLEKDLADAQAASSQFTVQITDLTAKLETAQSQVNAKGTEVTNLQAALEVEKRKALEVIAGAGISPDALPATAPNANAAGAQLDPIAKLRAQLEAATSPTEKYTLSIQIRDLIAKARK